ncbi:hypothetical protein BGX21_003190 [Mortierella sp. AD011]|nr:hypothetical protein BGX21_003190 [Mortierella sp. AD011]
MDALVGYEIGTPAYPDPSHDPTHQLPLTQSELTTILAAQGAKGGFFWELYKSTGASTNVDVTSVAQQVCKAALGASTARCSGGTSPSSSATVTATATSSAPSSTTTAPATTTTSSGSSCSAAAWSASASYNAGAKVSYNGHLYTAQWWSQNNTPTDGAPWTDNGACSGGATASPTPTGTTGNCASVSPYSSSTAYTGGAQVTSGGYIYTAQWWTQGDAPGSASVWVKGAACSSTLRRRNNF